MMMDSNECPVETISERRTCSFNAIAFSVQGRKIRRCNFLVHTGGSRLWSCSSRSKSLDPRQSNSPSMYRNSASSPCNDRSDCRFSFRQKCNHIGQLKKSERDPPLKKGEQPQKDSRHQLGYPGPETLQVVGDASGSCSVKVSSPPWIRRGLHIGVGYIHRTTRYGWAGKYEYTLAKKRQKREFPSSRNLPSPRPMVVDGRLSALADIGVRH